MHNYSTGGGRRRKHRSTFDKILIGIATVIVISVVLGLSNFGKYFWMADLFSNFTVQYFILTAILSVLLLGRGQRTAGVVTLFVCILQISKLVPMWFEDNSINEQQKYEEVSIMQYNVFKFNWFKEDAMDWIVEESENADIIVLHEVTFDWLPVLEALKEKFKYHKIEPRTDSWGVAVFSKLPYSKFEMKETKSGAPVAIVYANTKNNHKPFSVYAVHTDPPILPKYWKNRNETLSQVTELIREDPSPRIVLTGDLNVTRYSYYFEKLMTDSGLKDSYEGWGIMGTWPSILPNFLRIAIDHTLVSPEIGIADKRLGKSHGSDHIPVITIIQIPV